MVMITGENKMLKARPGLPMTDEEVKEWQQTFIEIEECIEHIDDEDSNTPYAKYMRMKQQYLF